MLKVKELLRNGIFYSEHASEKLRAERISKEQIREVLLSGEPKPDRSTSNNRERAWNRKQHYSVYCEALNLTVVCCESYEHGILVVSAYHGKSHDLASNPFNKLINNHGETRHRFIS